MITKQSKNLGILLLVVFFLLTMTMRAQETKKSCCPKHETCKIESKSEAVQCETDKETGSKSIETLHKYVGQLWHKDFPDMNLENMKKDMNDIITFLPALDKIKLVDKSKNEKYVESLSKLRTTVEDLNKYLIGLKKVKNADKELKSKITNLHNDFHKVAELI